MTHCAGACRSAGDLYGGKGGVVDSPFINAQSTLFILLLREGRNGKTAIIKYDHGYPSI